MKNTNNYQIKLVSIILPTYNEAENIIDLINAISKQVKYKKEIIVVDDNSPDGTSDLVKKYIAKRKNLNLQLETRYRNRGLANSIKKGIQLAKGDTLVWMDCDFSMPPKAITKLLNKIETGSDISVGSRFVKGGGFRIQNSKGQKDSPAAIILSRVMNFSIQVLLGNNFKDYTSGFIAIKKEVLKKVKLRGDYGEYFIDLIFKAKAYKFRVTELGYVCVPREKGESKTGQNLLQFLKRGTKYILLTFQLLFEKHISHEIP